MEEPRIRNSRSMVACSDSAVCVDVSVRLIGPPFQRILRGPICQSLYSVEVRVHLVSVECTCTQSQN